MIDRLISELTLNNHERIRDININYIFDPIKRKIIEGCIYLYDKGQPTTIEYLTELFISRTDHKRAVPYTNAIRKCQDITAPFIGDTNEQLRKEYMQDVLTASKITIDHQNLTPDQKILTLQETLKKLEDETSKKYEYSLKAEIQRYRDEYGTARTKQGNISIYDKPLQMLFGEQIKPFFYVIGGRPGGYKTSLLLDLHCQWVRRGHKGLHFSLEDNQTTYTNKMMANFYGVSKNDLSNETIDDRKKELIKLQDPEGDITIINKFVDKTEMSRIVAKHAEKGIEFASIDYLQIIDKGGRKEHEELGLFTKEIMKVCKEYKIPFIGLTQLNRDSEKERREPTLADLKGSGNIEQDARFVIALWDDGRDTAGGKRNATILKNTWGKMHTVSPVFRPEVGNLFTVEAYHPMEAKKGGRL